MRPFTKLSLVVGGVLLATSLWLALFPRTTRPPPKVATPSAPTHDDAGEGARLDTGVARRAPPPQGSGSGAPRPPPASAAAKPSPKGALRAQEELLARGDLAGFRQTFLPPLDAKVGDAEFEACKRRLGNRPVTPDWEMAEEEMTDAGRVVRVSVFGKSMTGFHEVNGRWLADAVWCVPSW